MGGAELRQGQYGFFVLLHEMGHALGLKHSFESPALPAAEDNMDHSIMSYTDGTYAKRGFGLAPATPAPDDIAALQFLYGANMSTNAGDNRYTIKAGDPLHTIWDAGGHDIIDTTSYNAGAVIDLQEGGDHPIHLGSTAVWLAYNSHIEDAVAGAGNDTIIGNTLNNVLTGNAGNDSIVGGGGSDQIFGNDGNDTIGAGGNSLIDGGNGIDAISYQSASGVVVNLQDILGTGVDSLGDTIRSIEAGIFGSPGNDSINGNAAANYLTGGDGGDLIQGFAGNDSLNGNAGNDSIAGGDGLDVIFGGQGDDSLNGNAGADIRRALIQAHAGEKHPVAARVVATAVVAGAGVVVVEPAHHLQLAPKRRQRLQRGAKGKVGFAALWPPGRRDRAVGKINEGCAQGRAGRGRRQVGRRLRPRHRVGSLWRVVTTACGHYGVWSLQRVALAARVRAEAEAGQ